ncbi:uncharacterized protein MCAP_0864-like isoform X1 [Onthophagus taurus]|uniref:uncharacterized protein MCAP_0864-like isoform X1 n=1 Tax=Onthophagus taurus TaxID=166361 RepID=UPI0039BE395B
MLKITLIVLLIKIVHGDDGFCECSCEGTKQDIGFPICDQITGKCDCKPGFSGKDCGTCIDSIPSRSTCKTCDCPDRNNKCLDQTKFNDFLKKFQILKDIISTELHPEISDAKFVDLKKKIDQLYNDLKDVPKLDLMPLKNLMNDADDVIKKIQDILNKYKNEDLLKDDLKKLNDTLGVIDDLEKALEHLDDYKLIDKLVKEANDIAKNVENVLDQHEECLDVVDQFCNGKNTSQNLKDVIQEAQNVDVNEYFKSANKIIEDVKATTKINEMNQKDLDEFEIPSIPKFDEKTLKDNHKKLEDINDRINHTENVIKSAADVLGDVKKKKYESNIEKARAFNTILMAPHSEIQDIIDDITATIQNSTALINELNTNKTTIEEEMEKILLNIKEKDDELKKFKERMNKLESDLALIVPESDVVNGHLNMIEKMKENLVNLTAEYKKKRGEYQEFDRMLDEEAIKFATVINENIECLKEETKQVNEKINANEELLDILEKDLDNVVELVEKVDAVLEDYNVFMEIKKSLDGIRKDEIEGRLLCKKFTLT